jgi:hypothetical protein
MTKIELIAKAVDAAAEGDIDTVEQCFDIVAGWITPEKYEIDCILAKLCEVADRIRP